MTILRGLLAAAVIVAGISAVAFAQDATAKIVAPVENRADVAAPSAASVPAPALHPLENHDSLQCQALALTQAQMQADLAAMKTELAQIRQLLADMQAQQKPAVHSVADVPGK